MRAVEPVPAGIDIPDEVLDWLAASGISVDDPDLYLLVAPCDEFTGDCAGLLASRDFEASSEDVTAAVRAIEEQASPDGPGSVSSSRQS